MGKQWKQWQIILGGSKITAYDDCSHEIKRRLLFGRKVTNNLDSIIESRDITYVVSKGPSCQRYSFSSSHVWMWELDYKESWVSKNWYFWTMVLERLLKDIWTAWRSNQSILNEISPECSLEGLMLKLIYCFAFTVMLAEMKKMSNVSKWISFSGIPQLRKWQGLDFTQFCKVKHNLFKFAKEKVYY